MATKIVTKNSSTASAVPTASDLVQGELAVNVADKRLFTEDNAGAIVELGTNPSALTVAGEITANGGIALGDNDKATFGASDDLQIYHDGSDSYIKDAGAGNLYLDSSDTIIRANGTENSAKFIGNGRVELYYDAVKKFETTSTGIDVTGTVDTSLDLLVGGAVAGNAGTRTINVGTAGSVAGGIQIWAANNQSSFLQFGDDSTTSANHYRGFLSYNHSTDTLALGASGSTKVSVNSTGIDVTGTATVVGTTTSGILLKSSSGASSGFKLYNDSGTDTAHLNNHFSGSMVFSTNNTERMRISSAGHTMFATTDDAPGAGNTQSGVAIRGGSDNRSFFSASSNYAMHLNRNTNDGEILYFAKNGTAVGSIGTNAATMYVSAPQAGGMKYSYLNSTNAVMLPVTTTGANADGLHDLGLSTARFKDLYLSGAITAGAGISATPLVMSLATNNSNCDVTMQSANSSSVTRLRNGTNDFQVHTNGAERMRIESSGRVLVNTTDDIGGARFNVEHSTDCIGCNLGPSASGTRYFLYFTYNGTNVGSITGTSTATAYNTSSDQRLKENIADADDAGSKIDAIQVRKYDWKVDGSHQDYGMIAQELQAVAPEAVSVPEDSEEMMGVDYSKLVPMLIKEIQSLRNRVAQLEE